jgi:hypothetical protein
MRFETHNSKGQPVRLNRQEQYIAGNLQKQFDGMKPGLPGFEKHNALAYEIDITSLTQLIKSVTEQKFYEINFAEYLPVVIGEGAWSSQLVKYRTFDVADDFETGIINTASPKSKLASVGTAVDAVYTPVVNWAKEINYSLPDLMMASRSGNWDLVSSLEKARYRNWLLGIQQVAFWGTTTKGGAKGLLTMTGVNSNTTVITENISGMTAAEFNTFVSTIMEAYRANGQRTVFPTHFIIPETDYNGLISFPDSTYPLKTKLELLTEAFKTITRNPNFKVLPSAYAAQSVNAGITGLNKNRYVLLNYDADSVRMDVPVDYTNTMQNTLNGFQFQNVGYGQFSGAVAYRPLETLYFDWNT